MPNLLSEEIKQFFQSEEIQEIEKLNIELTDLEKKLPNINDTATADEINIRAIIRNTLNTLGDILEIIIRFSSYLE